MGTSNALIRPLLALVVAALLVACSKGSDTSSGGGHSISSTESGVASPDAIRLSAFTAFHCDAGWTPLDGAIGLSKGSGNGKCEAVFPGPSGSYRVELRAQSEYDGRSSYAVGVNRRIVHAGMYPLSTATLQCDCPDCPDKVISLNAGSHQINAGDTISFTGQEIYACGTSHGASAKWHELVFTRIN